MDGLLPTIYGLTLIWGATWGSFLNVVIYRLPAGLSVVRPASRCPACETPIRWWQNVPVLSYGLLGGRCASCKVRISLRYPAVEALAAALALAVSVPWVLAWLQGDTEAQTAIAGMMAEQAFVFALLAIALIDADTFMVPDVLSLPLIVVGLLVSVWLGELRAVPWQQSAAGALLGGGGLLAVQWGYAALTGREGLGTGDVKLMAALGAWLGLAALPVVMLLAALQGLLFAFGWVALRRGAVTEERGLRSVRHLALPFGPFLALAAVQWLLLHHHAQPWLQRWLSGGWG